MNAFLKVKLCTLGEETKVINRIKRKLQKAANKKREKDIDDRKLIQMQSHKKNIVSKETRATHLAIGFLKGHPHEITENIAYRYPDFNAIERMVMKYGEGDSRDLAQRFGEYKEDVKKRIDYFSSSAYTEAKEEAKLVLDSILS